MLPRTGPSVSCGARLANTGVRPAPAGAVCCASRPTSGVGVSCRGVQRRGSRRLRRGRFRVPRRGAMSPGSAQRVLCGAMGRGVSAVPPCLRRARNRRPIFRDGRYVLAGKRGRVVDPGGFGDRLVNKIRRRVARRAEILAAVGRHLTSKCWDGPQRKASGSERNLQLDQHDFSPHAPSPIAEIGVKGERQFSQVGCIRRGISACSPRYAPRR